MNRAKHTPAGLYRRLFFLEAEMRQALNFRRMAAVIQLLALAVFVLVAGAAHAQTAGTGNIQGKVSDATGASIANARVTLTEEATKVVRTATTDNAGAYAFPNINIGTYSVSVAAPSFQTYTKTGNVLEVGSSISINVSMTVGAATEHVEVHSDAIALQTEDVSFKQTVDEQDITEMPLNSDSRQITGLLNISGGTNSAPGGDFTGSKYTYQTISVSIAGGNGNTTSWRLDGGTNNDYMANGNLPFPFPDAVGQFSVESTVLGAQQGMHSGGLVNVVTRSGTNTFHGAAFEFIRNDYLDATNFFSASKDRLHENQFGGTFGGPIRRNKLFAFAGYQRLIHHSASSSTQAHVPTGANLAGDFSVTDPPPDANHPAGTKDLDKNACNTTYVQLRDPLTGAILNGNKYPTAPAWNAQALALQKYLPVTTDPCGLVNYSVPSLITDNQFVTRVDYTVNANNHVFGRYFIDGYQQPAPFQKTNILVTTASGNIERVQSFTLGEDWTISSRTVNSVHATLLRRSNNRGYNAGDINANTLGVKLSQVAPNGLQLSVSNKFTIGGGTNSVSHFNDNTLAIDDDMTLVRGRHQIVLGGEFVRNQLNISNAYEGNGNFAFDGRYGLNGPGGGSGGGDANLDFLSGTLGTFQQSKQQQNGLRAPIPSLYIQDTFHATNRLTMVAGIRWSPEFMPTDVLNRGTIFDYNAFLANKVSTVYPNAPAGTFFYGDKGVPKGFTQNSPWQFSPNVGVSFDPTGSGKSVIRAGAELIYDEVNFFTGQRTNQNPPFATAISETQTTTSGPLSFADPWSAGSIIGSPYPQPAVPDPAQALFYPQSQYIVMPKRYHPSYTVQWTMSVQHQFGHGWQMEVNYIGNGTRHAPYGSPLSPAVFIPGVWGPNGTGCSGVVLTGPAGKAPGAAGTPCSTVGNQTQRYSLTIANPSQGNQYLGGGGGSVLVGDSASANYNGLVTTVQHRLSSSFSLLFNHTWSKCLNIVDASGDLATTSVQDIAHPEHDYGPCGSDHQNVVNLTVIAKSHFNFSNRFEAALLNNWEFAPLVRYLTGGPVNITSGTDNSFDAVGNDRPNLVPGVPVYVQVTRRSGSGAVNRGYLNPAAFTQICPTGATPLTCSNYGTFGNVGRNSVRAPSSFQFDGQVSRIFPIHERLTSTLRLECFNVLNHPNFNGPSAGLTSSTFGQISGASAARVFQGSVKFNF